MANTDKTDFWWNGKLVWGINEIYYDLINVDVTHVPYAWTHRNTSFFLKTRLGYTRDLIWATMEIPQWLSRDIIVTDVKIVWNDTCTKQSGTVAVMWANSTYTKKYVYIWVIKNWCLERFTRWDEFEANWKCDCWKFFSTSYVRWERKEVLEDTWKCAGQWISWWIQMNKIEYWTTVWLFSDDAVEDWCSRFKNISIWDYLVVYESNNWEWDWLAWQVRMVTWFDDLWRITLDSPWLWFKTPDSSELEDWESRYILWRNVSYAVYSWWWEDIWFVVDNEVRILTSWYNEWETPFYLTMYKQEWSLWNNTNIISVAEANDKVFILTDNGYIHYTHSTWMHNKFFINDDMDAWWDKTSIVAYRDFILAFGRNHIAVWAPDEQNTYWTMYNQSTTIWAWSRYSYAEYEWDIIFVSNDRRLLSINVSNTVWRYMLDMQDVWEMLNWKLATMLDTDEVFIGSDDNNLRVFVNTRDNPYLVVDDEEHDKDKWHAEFTSWTNTMTHIYKFDTLFKIWTEDHIGWWCMQWVKEWIYYWEHWLFWRWRWNGSWKWNWYIDWYWNYSAPYKSRITAFLIENENNKISVAGNGTSTWAPDLFRVAKLNRLITTLWPGLYSENTKIKITSYLEWIGVEYEFPIWTGDDTVNNKWVDLISKSYIQESTEIDECLLQAVEDSSNVYQASCTDKLLNPLTLIPEKPRCSSYKEFLIQDHWVCVNDTLYKLAPTMPLVTSLWENQKYSTEIRLDLTSENGDILCFGWWMAELFIAPLWLKWSDWEYELSPISSC